MKSGIPFSKYNLGCGADLRHGYINVDVRDPDDIMKGMQRSRDEAAFMHCDLSVLPWEGFATGEAREVLMFDFLEHFPFSKTGLILNECYRILHDEGELVIQVPDAEILASTLLGSDKSQYQRFQCNQCGYWMNTNVCDIGDQRCGKCGQSLEQIREAAMMRLFGGQDYEQNFHHTCFTRETLRLKALKCGLELVGFEEEEHQAANWNFKARFRKGDLWGSV